VSKINILFVIWGLEPGGAEKVVVYLANGLDRSCFRPVICCLNDRRGLPVNDDVKIYYLQKKPGFDPAIIWRIKDIIKQEDIHIINTHLWTANVWGRLAGFLSRVPVVVTEHSVDLWKSTRYQLIDRILAHFMSGMIAVSDNVRDFYTNMVGIAPRKIIVIPNGINASRFMMNKDPTAKKQELGLAQARPLIGVVGRLVIQKGHTYLIQGLPQIKQQFPDARMVIIGDGPERENLQNEVERLSLTPDVVFLGTRINDLPELYNMLDVVVLPSLREGLSMTLLEALASGKPVVTTDVSSNKKVISHDFLGSVVPPGNVAELAQAVIDVLQEPATLEIIEKRRQYVREHFSSERMIRQTEVCFKRAIS
jgi:glycosyltransferase involved in cell wall biosynthesis